MSTTISFLNAAEASATALPTTDVYNTPDYGLTAELIDGGTWECAIDDSSGSYFPYLKRAIDGSDAGLYDIVSPYGYGGVSHYGGIDLTAFRRAFFSESRERGLVAEFLRTNPFDYPSEKLSDLCVDDYTPHTTFGVTFDVDADEYFAAAEGRHRTAVRKALRTGVNVSERDLSSIVDPQSPFRVMYSETMERVGAQSRLKLDTDYFDRLQRLGPSRGFVSEAVSESGEVLAASIFLTHGSRVHYHLAGSTSEGQRLGATNLLIDWVVRNRLPPRGQFHLGGGVASGDGLEKFKRSLSNRQLEVYLCRTTVNQSAYAQLCRDAGKNSYSAGFFPAYRAP